MGVEEVEASVRRGHSQPVAVGREDRLGGVRIGQGEGRHLRQSVEVVRGQRIARGQPREGRVADGRVAHPHLAFAPRRAGLQLELVAVLCPTPRRPGDGAAHRGQYRLPALPAQPGVHRADDVRLVELLAGHDRQVDALRRGGDLQLRQGQGGEDFGAVLAEVELGGCLHDAQRVGGEQLAVERQHIGIQARLPVDLRVEIEPIIDRVGAGVDADRGDLVQEQQAVRVIPEEAQTAVRRQVARAAQDDRILRVDGAGGEDRRAV